MDKSVKVSDIGPKAAWELVEAVNSGVCVDKYTQDQLVIFMAMAKGESRMLVGEPTMHTYTAIAIAEKLTKARFKVQLAKGDIHMDNSTELWTIECEGGQMKSGEA